MLWSVPLKFHIEEEMKRILNKFQNNIYINKFIIFYLFFLIKQF